MSRETRAILAIAGSDPSGGAGIQADLKTLTVLGVYGAAAVTCLTVQNTQGVDSCHPVAPELVYQQVAAVLADLTVSHVKIGMTGSRAVAVAIARALAGFPGEIVYDPVVFTSVGRPIEATDSLDGVRELAGVATVLTPNRKELELITGLPCPGADEALAAGRALSAIFPNLKAVVVKGGHLQEDQPLVTDFLLLANSPEPISHRHPRLTSANTHGTGCTMASAFAAYHQETGDYQEAFHRSVDFIDTLIAISTPWRVGHGSGGLSHHLWGRG